MSAAHCQLQLISSGLSDHKPCKWQLGAPNIFPFLKPHLHHSSSTTSIMLKLGCTPFLQNNTLKTALPLKTNYSPRDFWQLVCSVCFNSFLMPQALVIYFFCMVLVAEGLEYHPPPSFKYACEDVNHYYATLDHSKGEALKRKLYDIISNHSALPYNKVWEALKILDADEVDMPEASSGVIEIYSLRVVPKVLAGKPQGWNREHLWPRSYGLTTGPSLTDLHNIRPADVNGKIAKGNKFYGECESKLRKCLKPANKEAAADTMTDNKSWTPPMQVRGDIARSLLYMAVTYGYHQPDGAPGLRLSDSPNIGNREMGILSTLLRWNHLDPPSKEEKLRNERVCRIYQHNRNPFADHPEYADLIWRQNSNSNKQPFLHD